VVSERERFRSLSRRIVLPIMNLWWGALDFRRRAQKAFERTDTVATSLLTFV
jgi:hypothetical protein